MEAQMVLLFELFVETSAIGTAKLKSLRGVRVSITVVVVCGLACSAWGRQALRD